MILSDARNLDDMGAAGIVNQLRDHTIQGKGPAHTLTAWKRKNDYQYWQARIKENFIFDSVRILAEKRLAAAEEFMNQLHIETQASDLQNISPDSALV